MNNDQKYEELIYLNKERMSITNSKEFFIGKKIIKYSRLLKNFHFIRIFKELFHDIYAFLYKDVSGNKIIDFQNDAVESFSKKIIVYTCIFGAYDEILEPLCIDPNCDYFIFTDQDLPLNSVWKKVDCNKIPSYCTTPALKNRYVKMFPHKFFDVDYSIYIDGNLQIVGHPSLLVQNKINTCKTGIGMHLAPRENCIYEEARNVYHVGKINKRDEKKVLKLYKNLKMPHHYGMFECNVIVRDHKNENMRIIMEEWWDNFINGVKRDQLYFTLVLFKNGYEFSDLVNFGASVNDNIHFLRKEHL